MLSEGGFGEDFFESVLSVCDTPSNNPSQRNKRSRRNNRNNRNRSPNNRNRSPKRRRQSPKNQSHKTQPSNKKTKPSKHSNKNEAKNEKQSSPSLSPSMPSKPKEESNTELDLNVGDDFESTQKHISNYKLNTKQKSRVTQAKARKTMVIKKLKSLGYDPKTLSKSKQNKLMDKLLSGENIAKAKPEEDEKESHQIDFLDDDIHSNPDDDNIHDDIEADNDDDDDIEMKTDTKNSDTALDLDFGDILKTDLQKQVNEEMLLRKGPTSQKSIAARLRQLKKERKKMLSTNSQRGKIMLDRELSNAAAKRIMGEKLDNDIRVLAIKMKKKNYSKRRSQRKWAARLRNKAHKTNRKLDRRESNINRYVERKKGRKIGERISEQRLIDNSNV